MSTPDAGAQPSGEAAIHVEDAEPGIRVLSIARPQRMNALDPASARALHAALLAAHQLPQLRVLVLTGAAGQFCTGADLKHRKLPGEDSVLVPLQHCHDAIVHGPLPCIAAVEGAAYGAGFSLALACDRIVASQAARFCAPFTGIGLVPDVGMVRTLPRRVGWARAREWMIEGTTVDARTGAGLGLVDELAGEGEALALALQRARVWAARAPLAVRALRELDAGEPPAQLFARERELQLQLAASADCIEAVTAFRERRPARFRGA